MQQGIVGVLVHLFSTGTGEDLLAGAGIKPFYVVVGEKNFFNVRYGARSRLTDATGVERTF